MYTFVETKHSEEVFYHLVRLVWEEMFGNCAMENVFKGISDKVIFKDEKDNPIGTCEFIQYHPADSLMDFDFFLLEEIRKSDNVYEIDKLAVSQSARGLSHLRTALFAIVDYAIDHEVDYFVATIQEDLMRILTARYGLPIEIVGEVIPIYDSEEHIVGYETPVVIPIKHVLTNVADYKRIYRELKKANKI